MLFRRRRSEQATQAAELPIPLDMRKLVGPIEPSAFDKPSGAFADCPHSVGL